MSMQSCVFELRLSKKKCEKKETETSVEAIQTHVRCDGIPAELNAIESLNVIACKTEWNRTACLCVVGNRVRMISIRNHCKRATNYVFKLRKKSSYRDTFKSNLRLSNDMLMHGFGYACVCSRPIPADSMDTVCVLSVILFFFCLVLVASNVKKKLVSNRQSDAKINKSEHRMVLWRVTCLHYISTSSRQTEKKQERQAHMCGSAFTSVWHFSS